MPNKKLEATQKKVTATLICIILLFSIYAVASQYTAKAQIVYTLNVTIFNDVNMGYVVIHDNTNGNETTAYFDPSYTGTDFTFNSGDSITLTAYPNATYAFYQYWNGSTLIYTNPYTATYTANSAVAVYFAAVSTQKLTIDTQTPSPGGTYAWGNYSLAYPGEYTYAANTTETVWAYPALYYLFDHWVVNGTALAHEYSGYVNSYNDAYIEIAIPNRITFNWSLNSYEIQAVFNAPTPASSPTPTPTSAPSHNLTIYNSTGCSSIAVTGSIHGTQTYTTFPGTYTFSSGETLSILATPTLGYQFSLYDVNATFYIFSNPYSTTWYTASNITAYFTTISGTTPTPPPATPTASASTTHHWRLNARTTTAFNINYNSSFMLQLTDTNNLTITPATALRGSATLNANNGGGAFTITPTTSGVFTLTLTGTGVSVYLDNHNQTLPVNYRFTAGNSFTITWQYSISLNPPYIVGAGSTTLYFRSDTYNTYTQTGYGLDTTNTAETTYTSNFATGTLTGSLGFRIYTATKNGQLIELTTGTPIATVSRTVSGSGTQTATWSCPGVEFPLGMRALYIVAYIRFDSGAWQPVAQYVTHPLVTKQVIASTWLFTVFTEQTVSDGQTTFIFRFGGAYQSTITNINLLAPLPQEVAMWLGSSGDLVGASLYGYLMVIGPNLFYGLALLYLGGTYYLRYKRVEIVLVLSIIFGSAGLLGNLIPSEAYRILYMILLFAFAVVIYRLFK